jgi:ubiquinone/menaquinone biosynthesis C-methylase UbiE
MPHGRDNVSERSNSYVIDTENPAEMARLDNQDKLLTAAWGGPLPELEDVSGLHRVLDVACGSGGWALTLGERYPHLQVTGVDISKQMIDYANHQADLRGLVNVSFQVMDILQQPSHLPQMHVDGEQITSLNEMPDGYFDLVNARFIATFMTKTAWPRLVQECRRLLRPGGMLRLTEVERGLSSTSLAHEQVSTLFAKALHLRGGAFSPDGVHNGILPMLPAFLKEAGFEQIKTRLFEIDYSSGMPAHDAWYRDFIMLFRLARPFLIQAGIAQEDELERLYQRVLVEMDLPDFKAVLIGKTVLGVKP